MRFYYPNGLEIILFFPFEEYSIFHCTSQIHLDCGGKIGPEGSNERQISFPPKGPLYFPSKTHGGASFVTRAAPVLNFALC